VSGKSGEEEPEDEPFLAAVTAARTQQEQLQAKHEQMRQSVGFQASLEFLRRTTRALSDTLLTCDLAATRWNFFTENYLFPRYFDDVVESAVLAQLAIENGALKPARRELRYMLEVAVNTAFVDEQAAKLPFSRSRGRLQKQQS
jgi:hypothetical protein